MSEKITWYPLSELILSLKTGLNPRKNFQLNVTGSACPYITGKDIFNNTINVTDKTDMIDSQTVQLINKRACLESGLLLFASTGTGTVGRMAIIRDYKNDWNISETLFAIKVNPSLIKVEYLMNYLYSSLAKKQFAPKISKGSVPHLKVSDLLSVMVPVPSLDKQTSVVSFIEEYLRNFDGLCSALQTELSTRQIQYEYYREFLFSPAKNWKQAKLIDLLTQPITDGPHETPTLVDKGVPFISAEAIQGNKLHFELMRGFITEEYDEICCKKYKPQLDDIYMCKSGSTTGKVAIVETTDRFNIWSPLAAIRVDTSKVTPRFMFFYLQTKAIQDQVKEKASVGSQPNLSMRKLEQFEVYYPSIEEQQSIVQIIDMYDAALVSCKDAITKELELREAQMSFHRDRLFLTEEGQE